MFVVVGRIGRAHGIKGEVLIDVRTDEPEQRLGPGAVLVTDPTEVGPLTIAAGRVHSGRLLLRFAGVEDRTAAELLRGTVLLADVDPDELPDEDDEWYDHQLVGLDVVRVDGSVVGEVREVLHLPMQDVLAITRPDGDEVLVPFVAAMVPEVDVAANRLVIDPPAGLLEEVPADSGADSGAEPSEPTG